MDGEAKMRQMDAAMAGLGFVTFNEQRFVTYSFLEGGEDVPMPTSRAPTRWQCSYCKGLRLGEECTGCGAPRHHAARWPYADPGEPPDEPGLVVKRPSRETR